jgi:hypothetical protein
MKNIFRKKPIERETPGIQTEEERRAEGRKNLFEEIKKDGILENINSYIWRYEELGKPYIARALEQHAKNLNPYTNERSINLFLDDKNLDEKFAQVCFPIQTRKIKGIEQQIVLLADKRNIELYKLKGLLKIRARGIGAKDVKYFFPEIDKIVSERIEGGQSFTLGTDNYRPTFPNKDGTYVTLETLNELRREVIGKYDKQIIELCKQKGKQEAQIVKFLYHVQKSFPCSRIYRDLERSRKLTKADYKIANRVARTQARINEISK